MSKISFNVSEHVLSKFDKLVDRMKSDTRNKLIKRMIEVAVPLSSMSIHEWINKPHFKRFFEWAEPPEQFDSDDSKILSRAVQTKLSLSKEVKELAEREEERDKNDGASGLIVRLMKTSSHLSKKGFDDWVASAKTLQTWQEYEELKIKLMEAEMRRKEIEKWRALEEEMKKTYWY